MAQTGMQSIIILKAGGDYEERTVEKGMDYSRLLNHGKVAVVPERSDRASYFKNMPTGIVCYVSGEAGRDQLAISEWTELLHVTGLMDDTFKCIFGDVIIECDTDDARLLLCREIHRYHQKTHNPTLKWTHIKRLAASYGRLVACGNTECGKPSTQHCAKCGYVMYCSRQCQLKEWPIHRMECASLAFLEEDVY